MTPGTHTTIKNLLNESNKSCIEENNEILAYNNILGIVDRITIVEQTNKVYHLICLVALITNPNEYIKETHVCGSDREQILDMAFTSCERFNARLFLSISGVKKRV